MNATESPARALVNRGALRLAEGDLDEAETLLREAVSVDPANATAHVNLGYLLACRGEHDAAIAEAEEAIALEPTRGAPWAHMGMSMLASGRVEAGLAALSRSVRLDPGNHFAWDAMGRALLALGRPAAAEEAWAAGVAAKDDDVDLLISLATAVAAQDRSAEATRILLRATEVAPSSARAWTQLGVVSLVRQDYGTAGESLLRALDLDASNEEARYHLALLHVLVGAHDEAKTVLDALAAAKGSWSEEASRVAAALPAT